jgi:hypothetical protein
MGNQFYTKAIASYNDREILTLSTSNLPAGIYYVTASQADELVTQKLVIR